MLYNYALFNHSVISTVLAPELNTFPAFKLTTKGLGGQAHFVFATSKFTTVILPSSAPTPAKLGGVIVIFNFSSHRNSSEIAGIEQNLLSNICNSTPVDLKTTVQLACPSLFCQTQQILDDFPSVTKISISAEARLLWIHSSVCVCVWEKIN